MGKRPFAHCAEKRKKTLPKRPIRGKAGPESGIAAKRPVEGVHSLLRGHRY